MPEEPIGLAGGPFTKLDIPASFLVYKTSRGLYCADSMIDGMDDITPSTDAATVIQRAINNV